MMNSNLYPLDKAYGHRRYFVIVDETEGLSLEAQAETATQRDLV
jgi:hypothetical protein